ncbi:hypothetical protein LA080_010533 [Diaporthe eres]|uniref:Peptidase M1 membrane alanine aminopeptidase domain-containing protein n=1 Tax=Diaporthe vaccinii TaxID=105482 RepID=A0ABR4EH37_9PEZI|nr:hypothetical protein LA080_010533 [Diaporthe eres]
MFEPLARSLGIALACYSNWAAASKELEITFSPHLDNVSSYSIDAEMVIPEPQLTANSTLVTMYLWVAGIPTQRYDGDALQVTDGSGVLPLTTAESGTEGVLHTRNWTASRGTNGNVTLRFTIHPRVLNGIEWGPLFDTRTQEGGLLGTMISTVPLPDEASAAYTLPKPGTLDYAFSLWAVGNIHSYPEATTPDTDFATYWFDEPSFNTTEVSSLIQRCYEVESDFFNPGHTSDIGYNTFFPNQTSTGGAALTESFIYGWVPKMNASAMDVEYILAHEISHNFLEFDDTVVNATTISEGWAEYYSTRLLWRNKFITDQQYLDVENKAVSYYYNDAYNNLTDAEVQANPWGSLAVQKVPYGRGLVYLHNVDAEMRGRYHGTKSVDTITMNMIQRKKSGLSHGLEDWFNILRTYLGEGAVDYYNEVASGKPLLELRQGTLSPCFKVVQTSESPVVYRWEMDKGSTESCII